jgi:hypothetical protein
MTVTESPANHWPPPPPHEPPSITDRWLAIYADAIGDPHLGLVDVLDYQATGRNPFTALAPAVDRRDELIAALIDEVRRLRPADATPADPPSPPPVLFPTDATRPQRLVAALDWARDHEAITVVIVDGDGTVRIPCPDGWTPEWVLCHPDIGGSSGDRRLRQLRANGGTVEHREPGLYRARRDPRVGRHVEDVHGVRGVVTDVHGDDLRVRWPDGITEWVGEHVVDFAGEAP